jgi:hypothetical protein
VALNAGDALVAPAGALRAFLSDVHNARGQTHDFYEVLVKPHHSGTATPSSSDVLMTCHAQTRATALLRVTTQLMSRGSVAALILRVQSQSSQVQQQQQQQQHQQAVFHGRAADELLSKRAVTTPTWQRALQRGLPGSSSSSSGKDAMLVLPLFDAPAATAQLYIQRGEYAWSLEQHAAALRRDHQSDVRDSRALFRYAAFMSLQQQQEQHEQQQEVADLWKLGGAALMPQQERSSADTAEDLRVRARLQHALQQVARRGTAELRSVQLQRHQDVVRPLLLALHGDYPGRIEPLFALAQHHYCAMEFHTARMFAKRGLSLTQKETTVAATTTEQFLPPQAQLTAELRACHLPHLFALIAGHIATDGSSGGSSLDECIASASYTLESARCAMSGSSSEKELTQTLRRCRALKRKLDRRGRAIGFVDDWQAILAMCIFSFAASAALGACLVDCMALRKKKKQRRQQQQQQQYRGGLMMDNPSRPWWWCCCSSCCRRARKLKR